MPFGLANAPATFQTMINDILRDLLDRGVVAYLDDILIYSETEEEHIAMVSEVLKRLEEYGLGAAKDKCHFHQKKVDFLGYVVSDQGFEMATDKIQAIKEWELPRTVKDVQAFIGFANFYRRFIKGFSRIAKPLTDTLKSGGKNFVITPQFKMAFKCLKNAFTRAPILRHFDPELPIQLETDASDFAIGAVLSQPHEGRWHPVAFMSRKFIPAEINYEIHDKELLAIVDAFKVWRHYLAGAAHQIVIYTDHKNLEYFMTTKILNRRQARWAQELAAYNFKIVYRKGSSNGKADALSRRSEYRPEGGGSDDENLRTVLKPEQIDLESIKKRFIASSRKLAALPKIKFDEDLLHEVRKAAAKDKEYQAEMEITQGAKRPGTHSVEDGVLYWKNRLWLPDDDGLKQWIVSGEHDTRVAGHFGQARTLELVSRNFFWPFFESWIARYIKECLSCQKDKATHHKSYGLLSPLETPYAPWTSISWDFITGLPESGDEKYCSVWVVVDRFTKMAHFIPPQSNKLGAKELARIFAKEVWRLHGLPREVVSDRDSRFTSNF